MEAKRAETLEELYEKNRTLYNFSLLCKIPHPSFHEERIAAWLKDWAIERGFETHLDEFNNVLIRKPATLGYEDAPTVILQAHTDMVCEKALGVDHDFMKDPIAPVLDGDFISTGKRTTLGADNGIGVAMAMTMLESNDLKHPALEVLFTTAEEEDFSGALGFDSACLKGKYLINLDNEIENQVVCGSSGGCGVKVTLPTEYKEVPENMCAYRVLVSGLAGGHSGSNINKGHGNAIKVLGRVLTRLENLGIAIGDLLGGNFRLAIARDAYAVVLVPEDKKEAFLNCVKEMEAEVKGEFADTAPDFAITAKEAEMPEKVFNEKTQEDFLDVLTLFPDGINQMSGSLEGAVESSDNLGELFIENGCVTFVCEIRAGLNSNRQYVLEKIKRLAKIYNAPVEVFSAYPGWTYNSGSIFRKYAMDVYEKETGRKMSIRVTHGGLECGSLMVKNPNLDAISIGPDAWNLHSPDETLSVSSTIREEKYVMAMLEGIKDM